MRQGCTTLIKDGGEEFYILLKNIFKRNVALNFLFIRESIFTKSITVFNNNKNFFEHQISIRMVFEGLCALWSEFLKTHLCITKNKIKNNKK